ncbi:MAG: PH domain-containing protein [Ruminococcaceae bacterium]|nr:PH domain-containing protein [Oscillospiraceae bacterium]
MALEKNIIWRDKKRILGMPISFTRYALSYDRLYVTVGAINIKDDEVLLYRVRDISVRRSLWQRMANLGTVTVNTSDKSTPIVVLKNIKDPLIVKELIHENAEEMKIKRRIRLGETINIDDDDLD